VLRRNAQELVRPILYRPFDIRWVGYSRGILTADQDTVMKNMLDGENCGVVCPKRVEGAGVWRHVVCTNALVDHVAVSLKNADSLFPLYLVEGIGEEQNGLLTPAPGSKVQRRANLTGPFVSALTKALGVSYLPQGNGDLKENLGPEDIFNYMYALFHSPAYRERYDECLRIGFPRLLLTTDLDLFRKLTSRGRDLVRLHLLDSSVLGGPVCKFVGQGNSVVAPGFPKYGESTVRINKTQGFQGVPEEVWEFHIGGYQVCHKWLKDRRGRTLTAEDQAHYAKIVVALSETIRLMGDIDEVIEAHGGWPDAFVVGERAKAVSTAKVVPFPAPEGTPEAERRPLRKAEEGKGKYRAAPKRKGAKK
jgi:predicted helicase